MKMPDKVVQVLKTLMPLFPGFFGSLVSLYFLDKKKENESTTAYYFKVLFLLLSGTITSYYGSDLLMKYFNLDNELNAPVGFISGLFGMNVVGIIFEKKKMIADFIFSFLKFRMGNFQDKSKKESNDVRRNKK